MLTIIAAYLVSAFVIVRVTRRYSGFAGGAIAFVASSLASGVVIYLALRYFMHPDLSNVMGAPGAAELTASIGVKYLVITLAGCLIMSIMAARNKTRKSEKRMPASARF